MSACPAAALLLACSVGPAARLIANGRGREQGRGERASHSACVRACETASERERMRGFGIRGSGRCSPEDQHKRRCKYATDRLTVRRTATSCDSRRDLVDGRAPGGRRSLSLPIAPYRSVLLPIAPYRSLRPVCLSVGSPFTFPRRWRATGTIRPTAPTPSGMLPPLPAGGSSLSAAVMSARLPPSQPPPSAALSNALPGMAA